MTFSCNSATTSAEAAFGADDVVLMEVGFSGDADGGKRRDGIAEAGSGLTLRSLTAVDLMAANGFWNQTV